MNRITLASVLLIATGCFASASAASWTVDPAKSHIKFTGTQTEQPFTGEFKTFSATIDYDPAKPQAAHVVVLVDTGSAATGDTQRDEAMPQSDWFDVKQFPQAKFEATGFKPLGGDKFEADGTLTIRSISKPVVLPFTLTTTGDTAHVVGHADLMRSSFGVGQGAWASPEWVKFEVGVDIDLTATKAP